MLLGFAVCATVPLLYWVTVPALPASLCQVYIEELETIGIPTSCPERPVLAMILLILMAAHHW